MKNKNFILDQFKTNFNKLNSSDLSEDWYKKLPNTDFIMNNTFWVGTFPGLGEEEIQKISKVVHTFVKEKESVKICC